MSLAKLAGQSVCPDASLAALVFEFSDSPSSRGRACAPTFHVHPWKTFSACLAKLAGQSVCPDVACPLPEGSAVFSRQARGAERVPRQCRYASGFPRGRQLAKLAGQSVCPDAIAVLVGGDTLASPSSWGRACAPTRPPRATATTPSALAKLVGQSVCPDQPCIR